MTRNTLPAMLTPVLVVTAVAIGFGLGGAPQATEASATENPVPACLTDDLTATVDGRARAARSGTRDAVLSLTNTSGRTCHVRGWADVAMVTAPGELVPVPTRQIGAGAEVVLEPRAAARSALQWDTCEPSRKGCGVGVALQFIVDPDSTGTLAELAGVPEAEQAGITMKALRVSPLQPA
jgi:hypothetical protein